MVDDDSFFIEVRDENASSYLCWGIGNLCLSFVSLFFSRLIDLKENNEQADLKAFFVIIAGVFGVLFVLCLLSALKDKCFPEESILDSYVSINL